MRAKLTVLIPCKNERSNIRACVESVRDVADEILIADSGSNDGTLDIVRQIGGCRIIEREYVHSANFKNWAIPQAVHPWVLIVDADERVTEELAAEIHQVLETPDANIDGYWIGRRNHFLGYHIAHCGWNSDDVLRLFRRDVCRYRERWVHAEIELPRDRVQRLKHEFDHFTAWSSEHHWHKLNRYATWGALEHARRRKASVAVCHVRAGAAAFPATVRAAARLSRRHSRAARVRLHGVLRVHEAGPAVGAGARQAPERHRRAGSDSFSGRHAAVPKRSSAREPPRRRVGRYSRDISAVSPCGGSPTAFDAAAALAAG